MEPNSNRTIEIFTEAIQLPLEERTAFLDQACAGDEILRRKIEALLVSSDRAGDFLEEPPTGAMGAEKVEAVIGEKPGDQVDRYRLLEQIGEGGCGIVFVAEQEAPVRRRVALKVVKPGMDTKSVIARFEAERQALALMDHPNIAHVFDAGATKSGRPYFVMELVDGVKITEYCDRLSLPISERLELFVQVCDAIQHAHQKGIIHRDIKPSNILVTTGSEGRPAPKVIDFGIAKATAGQQLTDRTIFTAVELLIGTPAYMSPEQAALSNMEVDTRTDIYSLGVLLYELLTGTTPFDARELLKAGLDEIRRVVREEEPVRPSTRLTVMSPADLVNVSKHHGAEAPKLIREMRGDLDWIVMQALEKDRRRRYATANGLAVDVKRYLSGEAISARPPSATYKLQKSMARNKLLFSGLALIFILLVTSLIATSRWLIIEKRTREQMLQENEIGRLEALGWELAFQKKSNESARIFREALALRRQSNRLQFASAIQLRMEIMIYKEQHELDEVRPLLRQFETPSFLSRLDFQDVFQAASSDLAENGRWADADALAEVLCKADPNNSSVYHLRAPILVAKNDLEGYRQICREIISRFSNASDPHVADKMAKDCLILPSSGVDLRPVVALADLAIDRGSTSSAAGLFKCCKALAELRLGHHEAALKWAQQATQGGIFQGQAEAFAIVAMAQFKLNKTDEARAALVDCNKIVEEKLPKPDADLGKDWRDWIIAHALQSEAKLMIDGASFPPAVHANLPH
jgi:serine/threonine protein kinase